MDKPFNILIIVIITTCLIIGGYSTLINHQILDENSKLKNIILKQEELIKIYEQRIEVMDNDYSELQKLNYELELNILDVLVKATPREESIKEIKQLSERELIDKYIHDVCELYSIDIPLVQSMVYHESRYTANAKNGDCIGPLQVSKKWHTSRAEKLGVDLQDTYGNILTGVDYLSELFNKYKDVKLVLMMYNMRHDTAMELYRNGKTTNYVESVLTRANGIREGVLTAYDS